MNFKDKFTNSVKLKKEPIKEKDKLVLTSDAYAIGITLESYLRKLVEKQ